MATYTIELRKICNIYGRDEVESWFKSYNLNDYLTQEQITVLSKENIWTKEKLAKMIVDHYFMREIGFETPALFKHYAMCTMNEIMESYLLKIYTKFLEYDPLSSVDYTETYERKITGSNESQGKSNTSSNNNSSSSSNSTSNSNSSGLNVNSNTPQGQISKSVILAGNHASSTSAQESETDVTDETKVKSENISADETTTTSSGNSETIETYEHTMKGDNGVVVTNQYLVREFREIANNFNLEIIKELNILFMGLY